MSGRPRLGLLGGTFNPLHHGHLAMAGAARTALGLDGLWLIPAGNPAHRDDPDLATAATRLAWCRRVAAGIPGLDVWDGEIRRATPAWTFETLSDLRGRLPEVELFWVVGWDAFVQLPSWHRWRELFDLTHFAVIARDGSSLRAPEWLAELGRWAPTKDEPRCGGVFPVEMPRLDVSATAVRQAAQTGRSLEGWVPGEISSEVQTVFLGRL